MEKANRILHSQRVHVTPNIRLLDMDVIFSNKKNANVTENQDVSKSIAES